MRRTLALVAALASACPAAEPSGLVESVDGTALALRFDATAAQSLSPGCLVALYGPGAVERHPLTKEVLIERPQLAAKAQITALAPAVRARVVWQQDGARIAPGWDAVAIPERAPDAPPALTAPPTRVAAPGGTAVAIAVPVADPESGPLTCLWELPDTGRSGSLSARTSARPTVTWNAPLAAGEWTLALTVRDRLGQACRIAVPLASTANPEAAKRALKPFAAFGEEREPAAARVRRDEDGRWWAIDRDGGLWRCDAGWRQWERPPYGEQGPKRAAAIAFQRGEVYVLDSARGVVAVHGANDAAPHRTIAGLLKPTDVAVAPDGAVLVADQGQGGVLVFEADGRPRLRLGRPGEGSDDFKGLLAVACDGEGTVYALDQAQRRVLRWDRFGRLLAAWTVPSDEKDPPVDCCARPGGLLVLLQSGKVVAYDRDGKAGSPWAPPGANLAGETRLAAGIGADLAGEVVVAYPERGLLVRYGAEGALSGLRGPGLRKAKLWGADGAGRLVAVVPDDHRLLLTDPDGWITALLGVRAGDGGPLQKPVALAVAAGGRWAAVADARANQLARFDLASPKTAPKVFAQKGEGDGQISGPVAVAVDDAGRTYVLDDDTYRIAVFDGEGTWTFNVGKKGKGPADLYEPERLAVSPDGAVAYVYDAYNRQIKKFALDHAARQGKHLLNSPGKGDAPGQLRSPVGLGVDRQGLVWVADADRGDLQILDLRGDGCLPVNACTFEALGIRKPTACALAPDGQAWIASGDAAITGLR